MSKATKYIISPIFNLGAVPHIKHCVIQEREYRNDGKWYYFIRNDYNSYASGWADEDSVISEIANAKQQIHKP